jgi:hypothetical protein
MIKSHRQFPGGGKFSKQHFGNYLTTSGSRIPTIHDGFHIRVVFRPWQIYGASWHIHSWHRPVLPLWLHPVQGTLLPHRHVPRTALHAPWYALPLLSSAAVRANHVSLSLFVNSVISRKCQHGKQVQEIIIISSVPGAERSIPEAVYAFLYMRTVCCQ